MNYPDSHVVVRPQPPSEDIGIWLFRGRGQQMECAKRTFLNYEPHGETWLLPEPTLSIPKGMVKELARALVESGDLPRDFLFNERERASIRDHLGDMKKMNERLLGIVEAKL